MKKQFNGTATMNFMINDKAYHEIRFRLWENYGKKRIYFESTAIKGYIDCNNDNEIIISKSTYSAAKNTIVEFINTYEF